MQQPQEIVELEHEQVVARVAAVDVAKASGQVCTRVPRERGPGRWVTKVWQVDATTNAILELAEHLAGLGIEKVTLESTGVIRGAKSRNWTLPRSCRRGRVRDEKDKSGNDER